jgi:hypothetical protein
MRAATRVAALTAASIVAAGALAGTASAIPSPWKNCAQVNQKYPHGVGLPGARDKTSGTPVTTFKRNTRLYRIAMKNNKGLDRDKDGIACEKQ